MPSDEEPSQARNAEAECNARGEFHDRHPTGGIEQAVLLEQDAGAQPADQPQEGAGGQGPASAAPKPEPDEASDGGERVALDLDERLLAGAAMVVMAGAWEARLRFAAVRASH